MPQGLSSAWYERGISYRLASLAMAGVAGLLAIALAYRSPNPSIAGPFAAALIVGGAIWMMSTARTHISLALLMVYLAMADGVIKNMTMSSSATLGRDLLLYAIVIGLIFKRMARKERFVAPPFTGWIVAFLGVILVQMFNPNDVSISHSIASTRPHLEFVPLFFLGYSVLNTRRRLKGFLMLLLICAAANGVAGLAQFSISPAQLASWGPGYAAKIKGGNGISARGFVDSTGQQRTRPFGLGGDMGFGGAVGLLALPAAIALLSLRGNRRMKILVGVLGVGAVIAVITSQARTDLIAAVLAIVGYFILATSARRLPRVLFGAVVAGLLGFAVLSVLVSSTNAHLFDRYKSIAPSKVFSTAVTYRQGTIAEVPVYMGSYPLGAGIGKTGPAGNSFGGSGTYGLNAESEPTYLILELGIPGLLVVTAFQLRMIGLSFRMRRLGDFEMRALLAAVAAPLFAILISGFVGISTAATPDSPYLWFASGVLVFWLHKVKKRPLASTQLAPAGLREPAPA
jgi:hypothetical protein